MFLRKAVCLVAVTGLVLAPTACDGNDVGVANLEILLTDAPSDYFESVQVWISRVSIHAGGDLAAEGEGEEGSWVDLFNDPESPQEYDLLTLQNGVTAALTGEVTLPAGPYGQLRMVVDRALITLNPLYTFEDGERTMELFVPSGMQTGIKVLLEDVIPAEEGTATTLTVDFAVDDNFVFQGDPEAPTGIRGILFTPVLRELSREEEPAEG